MNVPDRRFFLRLNVLEYPWRVREDWLVSGQWYRGCFMERASVTGPARRRVQLFHPSDLTRAALLFADQLEPDSYLL